MPRPLEDVANIVRRTLEFCPGLVENTEGIPCINSLKKPEAATGHVRYFAVCGFAEILADERDLLLT